MSKRRKRAVPDARSDAGELIVVPRNAEGRRLRKDGRPITTYTVEENKAQEATVEALLVQAVGTAAIARVCRERHGVSPTRVAKLISRLRARWAAEEEANRPTNRASAIRRCMRSLQEARAGVPKTEQDANGRAVQVGWLTPPDHRLAYRYECLLADLQGTRSPIKFDLNVDARVSGALGVVIASLSPEQIAQRLAVARERTEKARRYDALGSGDAAE